MPNHCRLTGLSWTDNQQGSVWQKRWFFSISVHVFRGKESIEKILCPLRVGEPGIKLVDPVFYYDTKHNMTQQISNWSKINPANLACQSILVGLILFGGGEGQRLEAGQNKWLTLLSSPWNRNKAGDPVSWWADEGINKLRDWGIEAPMKYAPLSLAWISWGKNWGIRGLGNWGIINYKRFEDLPGGGVGAFQYGGGIWEE